MTKEQQLNVTKAICEAPKGILARAKGREAFANRLFEASGYWNYSELKKFVEEMRGLNLQNNEDRQLFLDFFFCWFIKQE